MYIFSNCLFQLSKNVGMRKYHILGKISGFEKDVIKYLLNYLFLLFLGILCKRKSACLLWNHPMIGVFIKMEGIYFEELME